jgi:hypothetical protein
MIGMPVVLALLAVLLVGFTLALGLGSMLRGFTLLSRR